MRRLEGGKEAPLWNETGRGEGIEERVEEEGRDKKKGRVGVEGKIGVITEAG